MLIVNFFVKNKDWGRGGLINFPPGGGTWVFFGWVCATRDSKLAPRSKKNFP